MEAMQETRATWETGESPRAVILAGGLGMRLRPYTMVLPKPLIPVGDHPILEHIIRRLAASGVRKVDLCLGTHLGALIETYFRHATDLPGELDFRFHWEDEPLGTAGALRTIDDIDGPFIVMNGDLLTTLDYSALLAAHAASGAALTIAMQRQTVDISLGVIECENGSVCGYREKPSLTYDASMGIYVYDPRALEHLPPDGPCQFPDFVLRLLEAGERVVPFRSDAIWCDIGTMAEYERAVQDLRCRPELFALEGGAPGLGPGRASPQPGGVPGNRAEGEIVAPDLRARTRSGHGSDAARP
jgi:NDP-sugar pyrophosphorylase family protein